MKLSAGLLPFRRSSGLEVLIAHPGGPFWAARDVGFWGVIKGEVAADEEPTGTARREFTEETGWIPPEQGWLDLGSVTMRSGKVVLAWGVEADFDLSTFVPGLFTMTWKGRRRQFPEIDRVAWCNPQEAVRLLNPAQIPLVERLLTTAG
jgi:predicted NUDIX family NTP pyrophosphohydrolase